MTDPTGFLNKLYDIDTYKGCRVTRVDKDRNTLVVHGVRGTELKLTFRLYIEHFKIRISVSGNFVGQTEPNHCNLVHGSEIDDKVKEFWTALADLAFKSSDTGFDQRQELGVEIILGTHKPKPKRK